jgi:dTDP-4-dehydrorhamnose 3,5-epimerase
MSYKDYNWHHFNTSFLHTFKDDVPVYTPSVYREYRGEIFTTYHSELHPVTQRVPKNVSTHSRFSKSYKNVLRGLHYDNKTWKLVQALVGDIYLVLLDVRKNSPTYGKWEPYTLSEKTRDQVLVPPGFANGHYALTDCIFHYTLFYEGDFVEEKNQGVIRWNNPEFNIEWPSDNPILQKRDR